MIDRIQHFFFHEGGWFLLIWYIIATAWWFFVCFKGGARWWGKQMEDWFDSMPSFLQGPQFFYSTWYLKIFMWLFMIFATAGVVLVVISNV